MRSNIFQINWFSCHRLQKVQFPGMERGTGLGLAISRRIGQEHGGTLTAANRDDADGAVFTVFLPHAHADVEVVAR